MKTVVLIDDEYFFRQSLHRKVDWNALGFTIVGEANNGEDGFQLIASQKPDLALIDLNMPVLDGFGLCERLQTLPDPPKIIILTGYEEFTCAQQAIRYGVKDYLLKPVDSDELKKALETIAAALSPGPAASAGSRVDRIKTYIQEHLSDPTLSIESISKHFYLSYHHLCTIFKRDTGITLNEYVMQQRMEQARRLLDEGNTNISLVASAVGFDDANYFSRVFKKQFDISPTGYLRSCARQDRSIL